MKVRRKSEIEMAVDNQKVSSFEANLSFSDTKNWQDRRV